MNYFNTHRCYFIIAQGTNCSLFLNCGI